MIGLSGRFFAVLRARRIRRCLSNVLVLKRFELRLFPVQLPPSHPGSVETFSHPEPSPGIENLYFNCA